MVDKSVEDILSGFLESLGEAPVTDNDSIRYGSLNLSVARKVSGSIIGESQLRVRI
jgi:hypothetical protein